MKYSIPKMRIANSTTLLLLFHLIIFDAASAASLLTRVPHGSEATRLHVKSDSQHKRFKHGFIPPIRNSWKSLEKRGRKDRSTAQSTGCPYQAGCKKTGAHAHVVRKTEQNKQAQVGADQRQRTQERPPEVFATRQYPNEFRAHSSPRHRSRPDAEYEPRRERSRSVPRRGTSSHVPAYKPSTGLGRSHSRERDRKVQEKAKDTAQDYPEHKPPEKMVYPKETHPNKWKSEDTTQDSKRPYKESSSSRFVPENRGGYYRKESAFTPDSGVRYFSPGPPRREEPSRGTFYSTRQNSHWAPPKAPTPPPHDISDSERSFDQTLRSEGGPSRGRSPSPQGRYHATGESSQQNRGRESSHRARTWGSKSQERAWNSVPHVPEDLGQRPRSRSRGRPRPADYQHRRHGEGLWSYVSPETYQNYRDSSQSLPSHGRSQERRYEKPRSRDNGYEEQSRSRQGQRSKSAGPESRSHNQRFEHKFQETPYPLDEFEELQSAYRQQTKSKQQPDYQSRYSQRPERSQHYETVNTDYHTNARFPDKQEVPVNEFNIHSRSRSQSTPPHGPPPAPPNVKSAYAERVRPVEEIIARGKSLMEKLDSRKFRDSMVEDKPVIKFDNRAKHNYKMHVSEKVNMDVVAETPSIGVEAFWVRNKYDDAPTKGFSEDPQEPSNIIMGAYSRDDETVRFEQINPLADETGHREKTRANIDIPQLVYGVLHKITGNDVSGINRILVPRNRDVELETVINQITRDVMRYDKANKISEREYIVLNRYDLPADTQEDHFASIVGTKSISFIEQSFVNHQIGARGKRIVGFAINITGKSNQLAILLGHAP